MDLNGDGHRDILSGSYSRMQPSMAGLFQVLYGQPDGTFTKAKELNGTDGQPLIIPIKSDDDQVENICTRPTAVDWDGDGDLDLVVGNFAGSFYVFHGKGDGNFMPVPEPLKSGNEPLRVAGAHSDPFVIDWDGDGDLDLISGSNSGGVYWAENKAGTGKIPELSAFKPLIDATPSVAYGAPLSEEELVGPLHATRVWVDDVNEDGKLDVLVGDNVTLVAPAPGISEEEFKKKSAEWQEAFERASRVDANDPAAAQKANQRMMELYNSRNKFMREERTGFVWLYLAR